MSNARYTPIYHSSVRHRWYNTLRNITFCCILVALILIISSPAYSQDTNDQKDINTMIWAKFSQAYDDLDYETMGQLYTEDAIYMSPSNPDVRIGREVVRASFERYFTRVKERNGKIQIDFRFVRRETFGDHGYEIGIYRNITDKGTEKENISYGKFTVILQKVNGIWQIKSDGYSTSSEEAYMKAKPIK